MCLIDAKDQKEDMEGKARTNVMLSFLSFPSAFELVGLKRHRLQEAQSYLGTFLN